MGQVKYANGFTPTTHKQVLNEPLQWKTPQMIFVCSMSDLFHDEVPLEFILEVFQTMRQAYWHRFQILTKRSKRLLNLAKEINWPDNVWTGVSVENEDCLFRIDDVRQVNARGRFISFEPLLGPLPNLNLQNIDWIIVGGESGPGARCMKEEWVTDIRDQCIDASVPFFFKQWGGVRRKNRGRKIQGRTWNQFPKGMLP
jgi:protein gp37